MKDKFIYIILAVVIIIGAIVYKINGFNKELAYSNRQEFTVSAASSFDISKVKQLTKEVLGNKKVSVQKVERFNNAIVIASTEISEEEKEEIINKINEAYNENIENDEIDIISISEVSTWDLLKRYMLPMVIVYIILIIYFVIVYNKLGVKNVILKAVLTPVRIELAFYSIIAITRIAFSRAVICISIGIFILTIGAVSICFNLAKEKLSTNNKEKENDN